MSNSSSSRIDTISTLPEPSRSALPWLRPLSIIGIACFLAFSLTPVLGKFREDRHSTVCMSNLQAIGQGLQMYIRDNDGTLPVAYHYNNKNPNQEKGLDDTGIVHWSSMLSPYVKEASLYVCPNDAIGGQPPTNFRVSSNNEGTGVPEGAQSGVGELQDNQVPRLSYTANEQLMPRPRGGVGGVNVGQKQNLVKESAVDSPSTTIAITEFTDFLNAVSGGGPGGIKFKSHRPVSALVLDKAGQVAYDTSEKIKSTIYGISPDAARRVLEKQADVEFGSKTGPHLVYLNAGRHGGKNNFLFLDGHVGLMRVEDTLDCNRFLWGTKAFNQGGLSITCPATGQPMK